MVNKNGSNVKMSATTAVMVFVEEYPSEDNRYCYVVHNAAGTRYFVPADRATGDPQRTYRAVMWHRLDTGAVTELCFPS